MSTAHHDIPLDGEHARPASTETPIIKTTTTAPTQLSLRDLAVLAAGCLLISDAGLYGLIDGAAGIDRYRCHEILREAQLRGITVDPDEASGAALRVMAAMGVLRP